MKLAIKPGTTDVTVYLFIQHSGQTNGGGLTALSHLSSGLVAHYVRPLANDAPITLATQTATGAHSDGGFVEIDATTMPGVYRFDLPDAVCAAGVRSVVVMLHGAQNMAPVLLEIDLNLGLEVASILALLDDARGEPAQGSPPVNPDVVTKIDYLYKAWRNKKDNNGTENKIYADNGTTVDHKQTTSNSAGTVTAAEWVAGP